MIHVQPPAGQLSVISLEIQTRAMPDWPVVRILVDGVDHFDAVAHGWQGFDPDDILGAASPLLPASAPRRVAVYRCSCGEAGCGVISPAIQLSADGRGVLWQDFRDYVGVFVGPLVTYPDVELVSSRRWNLPSMIFAVEQYREEIVRASQDRGWETPRRQTARLLFEQLRPLDLILPPDLPLRAVEPAWEGDGVVARFGREAADGTLIEQVIPLSSAQRAPARAAADLAEQLLSKPPSNWPHPLY